MTMSKKILMILAEGFEEIEAVTPVDILRRAGAEVVMAGLQSKMVKGAQGICVETDCLLSEFQEEFDMIILPGGMPGASHLKHSEQVLALLQKAQSSDKWIAAICASPSMALIKAGVLEGKKATCYPGFEKNFPPTVSFVHDRVVVDGRVVTSRAPGTALEFSLELVRLLYGEEKSDELSKATLIKI